MSSDLGRTHIAADDRTVLAVTREAAPLTPESVEFESLAAAYTLAQLGTIEAAPATLTDKLLTDADTWFAQKAAADQKTVATAPTRAAPQRNTLPWLAAAAMFALAVVGWAPQLGTLLEASDAPVGVQTAATGPTDTVTLNTAAVPQRFVAERVATLEPAGAATTPDLTGAVHWNQQAQAGYLTVSGLAVNDPQQEQYQLWVIDAERDAHPVDGGVFNARSATDIRIPFKPSLRVYRPQVFAITLERAGGVVVSDQQRMVALGTVSATDL